MHRFATYCYEGLRKQSTLKTIMINGIAMGSVKVKETERQRWSGIGGKEVVGRTSCGDRHCVSISAFLFSFLMSFVFYTVY